MLTIRILTFFLHYLERQRFHFFFNNFDTWTDIDITAFVKKQPSEEEMLASGTAVATEVTQDVPAVVTAAAEILDPESASLTGNDVIPSPTAKSR